MHRLMPKDVDCFHYQYGTCTQGKCPFQHRERARQSNVICQAWSRCKNCRNNYCARKHLDKETLKKFFHCRLERERGSCNMESCPHYHEKARYTQYPGIQVIRGPNIFPTKEKSEWKMRNHIHLYNNPTDILVRSSKLFIEESLDFIQSSMRSGKFSKEKAASYMKEILHCIFFLGHINRPSLKPEDVLREDIAPILKRKFADAFQMYKTQLPLRPPYSILLDVVVEATGDNPTAVLDQLLDLNTRFHVPRKDGKCGNIFSLAATVVSVCYFLDRVTSQKTKNYFGVSVACKGQLQREIFIDVSCIRTWNRNVALAVCLVVNGNTSVMLPQYVQSAAFHMLRTKDEDASEVPSCAFDEGLSIGSEPGVENSDSGDTDTAETTPSQTPGDTDTAETTPSQTPGDTDTAETTPSQTPGDTDTAETTPSQTPGDTDTAETTPSQTPGDTDTAETTPSQTPGDTDTAETTPSQTPGDTDTAETTPSQTPGDTDTAETTPSQTQNTAMAPFQSAVERSDTKLGALNYDRYYSKPPCPRCLELFPDVIFSPEPHKYAPRPTWEHGNCAECEAVSKLLNADLSLNMRVSMPSTITITLPYGFVLTPDMSPLDALLQTKRLRLAQNLKKTMFELGEHFIFYNPLFSEESTALVPLHQEQ